MTGLLMNNELERMQKEVAVTYFKTLSWHLQGGTEKKTINNLCQGSWSAEI
jgi:hypothetical protein